MKTRIIVDSTADFPPALKSRVRTVPLTVYFGEEEYIDGVTIDHRTFYEKLIESDVLPTTSQATPDAFIKEYDKVRQAGEEAVVITLASTFSGTYQSAVLAAGQYENIRAVDSASVAIGTGILVEMALTLAETGMGAKEIAEILEEQKEKIVIVALVDTLEYLHKGGPPFQNSHHRGHAAEYQTGTFGDRREDQYPGQGAGLKDGQQPAGKGNREGRRRGLQQTGIAGLQRHIRRAAAEIHGGQPVYLGEERRKPALYHDRQRDRHPRGAGSGGGGVFQENINPYGNHKKTAEARSLRRFI